MGAISSCCLRIRQFGVLAKWMARLGGAVIVLASWTGSSTAEPTSGGAPPTASAARLAADANTTTFELDLTSGVTVEIFTLGNPYRVIIDLPDVAFKMKSGTGQQPLGLVSAFRYGQFAEHKARVVIDTTGPVRLASAAMSRTGAGAGIVLKLALASTDAASFGAGTGTEQQASGSASGASAPAELAPAPKPPGRSKPVIVIDPGHGGIDPGATGVSSIAEKTVVLAVGQQLRAALMESGRYEVKMTRTTDVFVSLDRRLKMSADQAADLFISLHADSIEERAIAENIRGATIYTLSERASDDKARAMAEKENASDLIAGLEVADSAGKDQVRNILIDLLKRETLNFSADFSNVLASKLSKSITMSRDPQRSAAFKVLKQTHAPSVLVELGYMSNSQDQQQMTTLAWQKQVAVSISNAVQAYFSKRTAEHP
jgi:N-acetylmuramoyl-L-alanine amidase